MFDIGEPDESVWPGTANIPVPNILMVAFLVSSTIQWTVLEAPRHLRSKSVNKVRVKYKD